MGQKSDPRIMRIGIEGSNRYCDSLWYADKKKYADNICEDFHIRKSIESTFRFGGINKIIISRSANAVKINVHTSKPGYMIGRNGEGLARLTNKLKKVVAGKEISVNVLDQRRPEIQAKLVAENVAQQIEKRVSYRKAMKVAMEMAMKNGALGIKLLISGRLGGAEIARSEGVKDGALSLHTFRSNIDYGVASAVTPYGIIGIKVWVSRPDKNEGNSYARS